MKKYLFLVSLGSALGFGAMAQNGKGHGKGRSPHAAKQEKHDDDDDDDHSKGNAGKKEKDKKGSEKYAKNAPAKVREAFNRDFPNASNVSWTKSKNIWTASFSGSLFGSKTASYAANGTRVNNNQTAAKRSRTGIFGTRKTQQ